MPDQSQQLIAQGVYMAQLAAQKGDCKCRTCQILRKINDQMVGQFVAAPIPANPSNVIIEPSAKIDYNGSDE